MTDLYFQATSDTPEIDFKFSSNTLSMSGEAYPENGVEFFRPILRQLQSHLKSLSGDKVEFNFQLTYFNSVSTKIFYSMFELKPVGKHKICVCTNISCMLRGADEIVDHLRAKLNIDFGQVTVDGKFSLKEVECLAACSGAPMMQIGAKYYECLNAVKVDNILAELD